MKMRETFKFPRMMCLVAGLLWTVAASAQQGPPPPGGTGSPGGPGGMGGMTRMDHQTPSAQHGIAAGATRNALQFGPVGRWWDDHSVVQQIGLSKQQQHKMDSIFNANKPAIVGSYKAFQKAQANLEKLNKDAAADKTKVFAAVDEVNAARSELQKSTLAMLMQIRSEMSAAQIQKLESLK